MPSNESPNFNQIHRVDSLTSSEALADLIWDTAYNVYGVTELNETSIELVLE